MQFLYLKLLENANLFEKTNLRPYDKYCSFKTNLLYLTVQVYPEILFRVPDILIPNSSELYGGGSFYVGENMSSLCMYSVEL